MTNIVEFIARFERLTSHQPYPWQARLFESLVAGHVPHNIGAPTGAGKTNVIPCWLLALVEIPTRLAALFTLWTDVVLLTNPPRLSKRCTRGFQQMKIYETL